MTATAGAGTQVRYVGFWKRFIAFLIDSVFFSIVLLPVLIAVHGGGYLDKAKTETSALMRLLGDPNTNAIQVLEMLSRPDSAIAAVLDIRVQIALLAAIVLFWKFRSATPGKMLVRAKIVNARTLQASSTGQLVGRVFAYLVSVIPFFLGFVWIAFDRKKQGWHDKLAGTVVIQDEQA